MRYLESATYSAMMGTATNMEPAAKTENSLSSSELGGLIDEQHAREHEVRPRPYEGGERRVDDHRLGKRQRDGDKDAEIARAVQRGGVVDGAGDGIEEAFLHQKSHRRAAAV